MSAMVLSKKDRNFLTTIYRLAQQSVEGFALWKEFLPHLKLRNAKYWEAVSFNEDLLRIIITNTKRSFVVTTYILIDNEGQGQKGHNVFQLLERSAKFPSLDAGAEKRLLEQSNTIRTMEKIRILRNNLDAHHATSDDWKERFGSVPNAEFEALISRLYGVVRRCNVAAGFKRVSEKSLRKATVAGADRLMRALAKQLELGEAGPGFQSVDDWESGDTSFQGESLSNEDDHAS
jgi:hypothetical protein